MKLTIRDDRKLDASGEFVVTPVYEIDGRVVSLDAVRESFPDMIGEFAVHANWSRPVVSDACAVHPSQIDAAMALDAKLGVPVEYTRTGKPEDRGRPIFRNRAERLAFMKAHNLHDNNGYSRG